MHPISSSVQGCVERRYNLVERILFPLLSQPDLIGRQVERFARFLQFHKIFIQWSVAFASNRQPNDK